MEVNEKLIIGSAAVIFGAGLFGNCSKSDGGLSAAKRWENSQGTQGFINLNEVKDAFRNTEEMSAFETRVNEIFEGDNLIVFEAKEIREGFELLAREDLDGSKSTTKKDDLLFTLQVKGRMASLQGAGVNKYYKESWVYEMPADAQQLVGQSHSHHASYATSPFFWWWVLSPGWGGYYTPMGRYNTIYAHRTSYRTSSAYRSQTARNSSFGTSMSKKYGSRFRSSLDASSSTRKSYIRNTAKSSGFKSRLAASSAKSGAAPKSQMRSSSSARKSGFFSSSSSRSSTSRGYGGFRGTSGFGV